MRKVLMFCIGLFFMCSCLDASAQIKVVTPHKDLKVDVLRCQIQGEYCVIDMLFENVGPSDVKAATMSFNFHKGYDDMGNEYGKAYDNSICLYVGDMNNYIPGFGKTFDLPSEVPVKVRVMLQNISEIATSIKRLDLIIDFDHSPWKLGRQHVRISNIPISR